jgi:hypothetical protein
MRPPTERDQCQAKLDILIEDFMRADWTTYRDAAALATRLYRSEKYRTRPRDVRRQLVHAAKNRGGEGESARACDKGRRSPPRLILEIDLGDLLAVAVTDNKAGLQFVD